MLLQIRAPMRRVLAPHIVGAVRPPPACLRPHRGLVVGAGPTLPAGLPLGGAARAARPLHRGLVLGGAAARPAAPIADATCCTSLP